MFVGVERGCRDEGRFGKEWCDWGEWEEGGIEYEGEIGEMCRDIIWW